MKRLIAVTLLLFVISTPMIAGDIPGDRQPPPPPPPQPQQQSSRILPKIVEVVLSLLS